MRQVPENKSTGYLIVGNGKLARHFINYFTLLGISYRHWHRGSNSSFLDEAGKASKIIVLIPDGEIVSFIENHPLTGQQIWIHCSGALTTSLAESAHPLMTFADKLYDLNTYKSIPFIIEKGRMDFGQLFPELPNTSYKIESGLKKYYHAWCTMSGNFTTILWNEFFKRLKNEFGIEKEAAFPYLQQIAANLQLTEHPLTGPFARGDKSTIQKHLLTLEQDDFGEIYKAFYTVFTGGEKRID